ncbi:hypothetical protein D8674_035960 [Pyrus ussuriensis x Pyrus communis]|uniref:Uncharacterized protein n=1 Tax=Pyrus ussuriensis x Pyrus communis TaxID=2448454 RepID=A0A5N5GSB0_9ROSA|nr:hypothetical protein D8674_035960 [Pyrus ussuriensis x Pyrus communis]
MNTDPKGTVVFSTVGRPHYGFDIFALPILLYPPSTNIDPERRLSDSRSINFNAQFADNNHESHSLVFISERTGFPAIYLTRPGLPYPYRYFKSWSALCSSTFIHDKITTRLTPSGSGGEFHELNTDIVVFEASRPSKHVLVAGPPGPATPPYLFTANMTTAGGAFFRSSSGFPVSPTRVTPSGLHCFTPATLHDDKQIAVVTRRPGKNFRHIELFDVESKTIEPMTEIMNPNFHHYNPFLGLSDSTIPYIERVSSPIEQLQMLRIQGSFPTFSPSGDLIAYNKNLDGNSGIKVIKSDGSKHWNLINGRAAFYNAWSPTVKPWRGGGDVRWGRRRGFGLFYFIFILLFN